ncbi:MAG: AI-2E family transporter [Angustibacter sp.]
MASAPDPASAGRVRGTGDETVPWAVRVAAAWSWRVLLIGAVIYLLLLLVGRYVVLVAPVLIAVLLVALVRPVATALERARVPRGLAALFTVLLVLAVVTGLFTVVGAQLASGFSDLQDQAVRGLNEVRGWLAGPPLNLTTDRLAELVGQARESVVGNQDQVVSGAVAATSTASHVLAGLFITVFAGYFFLAQGQQIWSWVLRLLPRPARAPLDEAAREGWVTLTSFVRATTVVALVDGIGIGVGAALLGVPLAVPLGVLVFLAAFVPVVGALVSGAVAVLIALVAVGPVKALLMLAVVVGVQQLEAHVLQPFLLGRAVHVHPLAVILAIAAGALTAGVLGALFAVPLIATLNTMVQSLAARSAQGHDQGDTRAGVPNDGHGGDGHGGDGHGGDGHGGDGHGGDGHGGDGHGRATLGERPTLGDEVRHGSSPVDGVRTSAR